MMRYKRHFCHGLSRYKTGDVVVMIVDFETQELRFKIRNEDEVRIGPISPDSQYRVAVSLSRKNDAIQIIS